MVTVLPAQRQRGVSVRVLEPLPVGRDGPNARAFRERYDEMISGLVRMQDGDGGGR